jgi:hypothetical protein
MTKVKFQRQKKQPQQVVVVQEKKKKATKKKKNTTLGSILSDVGAWGGNRLSTMFGLGAYTLKSNSLVDAATGKQVPFMHSNSETMRLCHREYICDINSTTAFTLASYVINPGMATTFPYLNRIAQCFQQYEFKGIVFEFKSTSASALNSTNTALGTVMLACQYDASDPAFANKTQVLNEMWSVDGKPCEDVLLPIECHPDERVTRLCNLRTEANATPAVTTTYDWGKFSIATVGSQAVANVGELWVSYDVLLYKPSIVDSTGINEIIARASYSGWATFRLGDSVTWEYTDPRVTYGDPGHYGEIVILPLYNQNQLTFTFMFAGSTGAAIDYPALTLTNCTHLWTNQSPQDGATASSCTQTSTYDITDKTAPIVITLTGGTLPSDNQAAWWSIYTTV